MRPRAGGQDRRKSLKEQKRRFARKDRGLVLRLQINLVVAHDEKRGKTERSEAIGKKGRERSNRKRSL